MTQKNTPHGWCKIIPAENRDYLIEQIFSHEFKMPVIRITAVINDRIAEFHMGFHNPVLRDEIYAKIDHQVLIDIKIEETFLGLVSGGDERSICGELVQKLTGKPVVTERYSFPAGKYDA